MILSNKPITEVMCGSGGGDRGSGPPLENHKNMGILSNTCPDPLKSQRYQSSIQCWAIFGPPVKRHLIDCLPKLSGSVHEGADQTVHMSSLICTFVVCKPWTSFLA